MPRFQLMRCFSWRGLMVLLPRPPHWCFRMKARMACKNSAGIPCSPRHDSALSNSPRRSHLEIEGPNAPMVNNLAYRLAHTSSRAVPWLFGLFGLDRVQLRPTPMRCTTTSTLGTGLGLGFPCAEQRTTVLLWIRMSLSSGLGVHSQPLCSRGMTSLVRKNQHSKLSVGCLP